MFFSIDILKTKTTRNLVHFFREVRTDVIDCFKMQVNYGLIGQAIYGVKKLRSSFTKNYIEKQDCVCSTKVNLTKNIKDKKHKRTFEIPDELNAKLKKAINLYKIDNYKFSTPCIVTFISYSIPRFDTTAADYRLFNILKILLANKFRIDFIYCTKRYGDQKYLSAFKGEIIFTHLPLDHDHYIRYLIDRNPTYIYITELWRLDYFKFMTNLAETLKVRFFSFRVIVDTVDFHSKEFFRKYEWTNNQEDLMRANEFLNNEKFLYKAADSVIVVSETEKKDIQAKISGIKDFGIIPTIHKINASLRTYQKRRNICFVGNFGNKHNVDAVSYFIENILQLILERNHRVEFHVLGYSSDRYRHIFESANVKVIGSLKNLEEALAYYKLFVCPMTYGAGIKGKIGEAMAAGVPVVTTSIGAEGFPLKDGEECFIADSPKEFAEKCNLCLEDFVLWTDFSIKARLMIAENFSPGSVACKLKKVFSL